MIPVLAPTVCLLAGVLVGLRVNARRVATLRELLRDANKLHAAYITSAHNEDLAEVGPATPPRGTVEMYDQDADLQHWADAIHEGEMRAAGHGLHVSRSWNEDPYAPGCGCSIAMCGLVIPHPGCVQHDNGKTFRQAHRVDECPVYADPCGWVDGPDSCGDPAVDTGRVGDEQVPLCITHRQWALNRPLTDQPSERID